MDEIAELRTMWVFTPPEGQTWGLTFEGLRAVLLERDPEGFIKVEEMGPRSVKGPSMDFGITLDGEELEGFALLRTEGVAVMDCTARTAATFVLWLRNAVVPPGGVVMFNTRWGLEDDLPETLAPDATRPRIAAAFMEHLVETGLD
ncbi:hypothetical protein [Streptomyces acidiscabies]|uniref:Uncharacterized protein n=1 Tax=Streptomyces acidiscabies TaxID=42234 RepID=A0A0L0KRX8_9ACTN|nr:hypothetical protein [Streptomyces acidiscabies]KND40324.1 hypothetical protein IQ63_00240 [Streptomyces acidiscabies]